MPYPLSRTEKRAQFVRNTGDEINLQLRELLRAAREPQQQLRLQVLPFGVADLAGPSVLQHGENAAQSASRPTPATRSAGYP